MMLRVSVITLILGLSLVKVSLAEDQQITENIKVSFGEKLENMARHVWRGIHDHPYLSALALWCGVYHKTAYNTLETYGSNPWLFIPIVGTVLFYLLHDQHDFFSGKFGDNEHLELSINLGNNPKKDTTQEQQK